MLETEDNAAAMVCERIRSGIEDMRFTVDGSMDEIRMTVSMGYCISDHRVMFSGEQLYSRADKCLYTAKENGRNQVCRQFFADGYPSLSKS